ncbi:MAG: hypothetical protein HYV07_12300 [Deltaproteobacteria bacterium]|nr:hypothetical protein [Deltaproteobacteria bacterium]
MTSERSRALVLGVLLFLGSFASYSPSLFSEFDNFDTPKVLHGQPHLFAPDRFVDGLHAIVTIFPREEPLLARDVSYLVDSSIFGFRNPFGFHLTNVLLGSACVSLAFWLMFASTRRLRFAALVSLTWMVLPVRVEAISWVMGRKDVLSAFFLLSALVVQVTASRERPVSWSRITAITTLLGLACLSKISAIVGCVLMFLTWWLARSSESAATVPGGSFRSLTRLLPAVLVSLAVYLWYSSVLRDFGGMLGAAGGAPKVTHLLEMARLGPIVLALNFRLVFVPLDYSALYGWPNVNQPVSALDVVSGLGAVVGTAAYLYVSYVRRRTAFVLAAAFLVLMVPYSGVSYVGFWTANRYLFLSSFFLIGSLLAFIEPAVERWVGDSRGRAWAVGAALVAVLGGYSASTLKAQAAWRTPRALWEHEVSISRPSIAAYMTLGALYVVLASEEKDGRVRSELLDRADAVLDLGMERYRTTEWLTTEYRVREPLDFAKMHLWKGRAAILRGRPVAEQLSWLERAYTLENAVSTAQALAELHLSLAGAASGGDREQHVRASLRYFADTMATIPNDPVRAQKLRKRLRESYGSYEFVREDVEMLDARLAKVARVP